MVFLKATWSHDYLETLLQPSIQLFVQQLPHSFFEDGRRLTDAYCSDKLSSIFSCFFERADALLGLKAGVQPQTKIPHYLLSNTKARNKTLRLILRMIISHSSEASIALRYDTIYQHISSMATDEFLSLYAKCYAAISEERIGKQYILIFDPHMPAELKRLLGEACNKFKISSYFTPSSVTVVGKHSFSVHADEIYYHDEDRDTTQKQEDDLLTSCNQLGRVFTSAVPLVLCAPWFPSGDDKLRKVIVQPRRGRLQDNLAISRISFRVLEFIEDQYLVHMLRSPPSYDTVEQKQLVTEAKGVKPTASEVVHLLGSRALLSFDNPTDAQNFIASLDTFSSDSSAKSDTYESSSPRSVCLEVVFLSLQWLLDSLNYNELCELSDYTEQNITYVPIAALEESANVAAAPLAQPSDTSCKYYECHCGGCRFVFRDIEFTSPNLSYFYTNMRAHPEKYESSLSLLKKNIGYTSGTASNQSGVNERDTEGCSYDRINVTLSFGILSFRDTPNESRMLSFHGVISTKDVINILFNSTSDPSKWQSGHLSHALLADDSKEDSLVLGQLIDHQTKITLDEAQYTMTLINPRFLGRNCEVLKENFLLTAFSYIYNSNFDNDTEKILLSIIRCSDNQLELRKYLKIPDERGNLIPVSQIMDEFKCHRYKYSPVLDTFLFGPQFTGIADDGRAYGHTGSGLIVARQVLDGEIECMLDFKSPASHAYSNYSSLFQVTPNKWLEDVTIMYPLEKDYFASELSHGKLREQDYILFRNTIIHYYLTTQKRPFKCFVLYDILPVPVDTIYKIYKFMVQEGLINYNTESAMPLSSLIFAPRVGYNARDSTAKEVSLNPSSLDVSATQQVHKQTVVNYSETKLTSPLIQHHALLGTKLCQSNDQIEKMVNEAVLYMETHRTPLGLASLGARQLINALEDVLGDINY
ncbi:Hypothetical protein GLP15_2450 [Giardia lamblia P15]|uniref:SWIRM domain-containing protein n=1 Tax=Giardia intestinalis (strain P15) TaxID=658858 RepID=E1F6S3_GIAIA|nr:Hypothetical protein GLP15_2450 [Giardia lamblia P15]